MVDVADLKFYKAGTKGLGGPISGTILAITSGNPNNLFVNVTRAEDLAGADTYQCVYLKNTSTTEDMIQLGFWLTVNSGSPYADTSIKWGLDPAGLNGSAQTIANVNTRPANVSFTGLGTSDPGGNIGTLKSGEFRPIWIWRHVNAGAISRLNDTCVFFCAIGIESGGSGTGGGTGGGVILDKFGLKQFFTTKAGGEEWYSDSWANGHSRDLTQGPNNNGMWDIDENEKVGVARIGNVIFRINGDGTATCGPGNAVTSGETCRIFVKKGAVGWCNTEFTVAVQVRTKTQSIQLRTRANHHGVLDLPYGYDNTHDTSCGFGNYMVKFGDDDATPDITSVWNQVEVIQDLYGPRLAQSTWPGYTLNTWQGYKAITRTVGTTVNVQGWYCTDLTNQETGWVKASEFTYDGNNCTVDQTTAPRPADIQRCLDADGSQFGGDQIAGDINKNTAWFNPSYWNWIRIDETVQDVDLKWMSVREIEPGSGTGGGGTGGNPPPANPDYKIAVAGDWGNTSTTDKVLNMCKNYDCVLGVGDNAYNDSSADSWCTKFKNGLGAKFHTAFGNHEYSESGGISPYKTAFGLDKTYYSFDFQNVHVIVLDTNINMDQGSAQHTFAENDLAAYENNSATDWLIAMWHHPMFGASSTHSYDAANCVENFHSLLMQHKCAFVFTGHNHNWQLSEKVAYNSGSPTNPTTVDDASPFVADSTGLLHCITGTGGHDSGSSLYSLGNQPSFQLYQNRTHNGIFELLASNNAKTLTCSFVDTSGTKYSTITVTTP